MSYFITNISKKNKILNIYFESSKLKKRFLQRSKQHFYYKYIYNLIKYIFLQKKKIWFFESRKFYLNITQKIARSCKQHFFNYALYKLGGLCNHSFLKYTNYSFLNYKQKTKLENFNLPDIIIVFNMNSKLQIILNEILQKENCLVLNFSYSNNLPFKLLTQKVDYFLLQKYFLNVFSNFFLKFFIKLYKLYAR